MLGCYTSTPELWRFGKFMSVGKLFLRRKLISFCHLSIIFINISISRAKHHKPSITGQAPRVLMAHKLNVFPLLLLASGTALATLAQHIVNMVRLRDRACTNCLQWSWQNTAPAIRNREFLPLQHMLSRFWSMLVQPLLAAAYPLWTAVAVEETQHTGSEKWGRKLSWSPLVQGSWWVWAFMENKYN
jgi:hypothetical protein